LFCFFCEFQNPCRKTAEQQPALLRMMATSSASMPWRTTRYALLAQRVYRERAFRFDRCREAVTRAIVDG
jgi:hypothetical protein